MDTIKRGIVYPVASRGFMLRGLESICTWCMRYPVQNLGSDVAIYMGL